MDPYCGWDSNLSLCTPSPAQPPRHHWHQNIIACPLAVSESGLLPTDTEETEVPGMEKDSIAIFYKPSFKK